MQGSLVALTLSSWYDFDLRLRRCGFVDPQALDLLNLGWEVHMKTHMLIHANFLMGFERGIQSDPHTLTCCTRHFMMWI